MLAFRDWAQALFLIRHAERLERGLVQQTVHGVLNFDEFAMQGARLTHTADATSKGAGVRGVLPLKEAVDVEESNLLRRSRQRIAATRAGRAGSDPGL